MKKNKIIALALAAMLCAASLVSCDEADINIPDNTVTPGNETENNPPVENAGTDAAANGLSAYNWKYSDNEVLFTIAGEPVTFDMYRYYAMNSKGYYDNGDASYWNDETDNQYKNDIIAEFKRLTATKLLCNNVLGLEIDENDIALIDSSLDEIRTYIGEDALASQLDSLYLDVELYKKLSEYDYLSEKLYRYYVSKEDILNYASENYVHVQHVLVGTLDDAGNELTGEDFDKKTALANEIYHKATSGEDFYSLVEQYGEDPGMENNPDGYTFTYNMMVPEFEEASFALEVDGISEPVKTSYGYHIIKKLALEDDYFLNEDGNDFWNILYTLGDEAVNKAVSEYAAELEVVTTDAFDLLNMSNIAENK